MEEFDKIEDVVSDVKDYVETNYQIVRLELIETSSLVGSKVVSRVVVGSIAFLFIFFLSLAAGYYLSHWLNDFFLGFLYVSGFYLLLFLVFYFARKGLLENPSRNKIIRRMFNKWNME